MKESKVYIKITPAEKKGERDIIEAVEVPISGETMEELRTMQAAVQGHIEIVPARQYGIVIVCNEDGRNLRMRKNATASSLCMASIVGPALIAKSIVDEFGEQHLMGFTEEEYRRFKYIRERR